jgi:hypothetical protein
MPETLEFLNHISGECKTNIILLGNLVYYLASGDCLLLYLHMVVLIQERMYGGFFECPYFLFLQEHESDGIRASLEASI